MIRKICKKATIWLLAGVIGLSAVTVQAAEVDNGASYPITTNAIEGWPRHGYLFGDSSADGCRYRNNPL